MSLYILSTTVIILSLLLCWLTKKLQTYRRNDTYLQSLINYVPIGFYIKDLNGKILLANKAFANVTGFSKQKLENKNVKSVYSQNELQTMDKEDNEILKSKQYMFFEKTFTLEDGKSHHYILLKSPVFNSKKEITGFIVLFRNIDKEKELEARKESFIATLTHDLKTPTYGQINALDMLLQGKFGTLNAEQSEIIGLLKCSCQYVSNLVATVLDTYKCENGKINLKYDEFDMVNLISALCKGVTPMASEKNQNIVFTHEDSSCLVNADNLQVKRVIYNLLSNAITYGYSSSTIEVELSKKQPEIEVKVKNKSKYIPESVIATIFDRFKQTELSCFNEVSTGLGLYLSKQIVEMHKGKIFAQSTQDGACVFGFKLPISKDFSQKKITSEIIESSELIAR